MCRLMSPSGFEQEQSRRVLVERGTTKVMPDLEAWTKRQTNETAKLRALWMYQAFNHTAAGLLTELLAAKDARVRRPLAEPPQVRRRVRVLRERQQLLRIEQRRRSGAVGTMILPPTFMLGMSPFLAAA